LSNVRSSKDAADAFLMKSWRDRRQFNTYKLTNRAIISSGSH